MNENDRTKIYMRLNLSHAGFNLDIVFFQIPHFSEILYIFTLTACRAMQLTHELQHLYIHY